MNAGAWTIAPGRELTLDRPRLMAIINTTPDSFSDGGRHLDPHAAASRAIACVEEGADAIDIGAESTRPGAQRIDAAEQIRRLVPAIEAIRAAGCDAPITVDTTLADVARAALDAGADAVNDVSAGREDPAMLALVAQRRCAIVLMHRLVDPTRDSYSDQYDAAPEYSNHPEGVVGTVRAFLFERMRAATDAGVAPGAIAIDPGLGFGKSVEQNLELVVRAGEFASLGPPVLGAASRKSFIGAITGTPDPAHRVEGSLAIACLLLGAGVRLFRVHDVRAHARALGVAWRVLGCAASRTGSGSAHAWYTGPRPAREEPAPS